MPQRAPESHSVEGGVWFAGHHVLPHDDVDLVARRLAASQRPNRIFDAVKAVVR
jgi:hypothetical protein